MEETNQSGRKEVKFIPVTVYKRDIYSALAGPSWDAAAWIALLALLLGG